ncbi:MAG: 6,7-dimethyl-8-ribityllumazine synthase [Acidobacteria bacterium]|nr:6,7-dimethyl-8-ribityllumazine synthase [Acidobacteriota bacterium]
MNIGIVAGTFHQQEIELMIAEARSVAGALGLRIVETVLVPGSMEKPLALKRLLLKDSIDGAVVLGVIEKGETKHGLVMAQAVIQAIIGIQLETMKPVGTAILGPEIEPGQIPPRLRPYAAAAVRAVAAMLK